MHYFKTAIILVVITLFFINLYGQGGYNIEYNNTSISIDESGVLNIRESLDVTFSEERRGIYRGIPYKYDIGGQNSSISIDNISVDNHKYKTTRKNGEYLIRIGDPNKYISGKQKYILNYEVSGALSRYDDHDEFFWNIVGFTSESGTDKVSFTIEFPESWADSIYAYQAFSGAKGQTSNEVVLHKDGNTIIGAHRTTLPPNHGISLGVKIPKGLLPTNVNRTVPDKKSEKVDWVFTWWNLIPIGLASLLLSFWNKIEKKEKRIVDVEDQFYPPKGMNPAEVGTFFDHKANRRDIISLLPHWGNQGFISIKPVQGSESDMYFTKLVDKTPALKNYEQLLFNDLFEKSNVVLLSDLNEKFYKTMSKTSSMLKKEVLRKELYDMKSKDTFHSLWSVVVSIICLICGVTIIAAMGAIVAGIGLILIAITLFILFFKTPKLSEKGNSLQIQLKGLYNFLKEPESKRMNKLIEKDPNYLHHIYPYVLAFDLDQSWTDFQEENFTYSSPIWLDHGHRMNKGFRYDSISDSFNVRKIEKVFYSAPPPTNTGSGGGFSGGSAGGGFGGGSTGSW